MENFSFYSPTYFEFGKDAEDKVGGFVSLDEADVAAIYKLMV